MLNKTDWQFIDLLSRKALSEFTPTEYKAYVRSLFHKPVQTQREPTPEFTWRRNKKGTLCIRVNRKPKFLFRSEVDRIAKESGESQREVWNKVLAKKSGIRVVMDEKKK